jgi:transposase
MVYSSGHYAYRRPNIPKKRQNLPTRVFAKLISAVQRSIRKQIPNLFLYDVTSSYLKGDKNELAQYGYNRNGKKGKKQIVIGLLTDGEGYPVSCEVIDNNIRYILRCNPIRVKEIRENRQKMPRLGLPAGC